MAGEEFRATLCDSDATLGVVRAQDVAQFISGLEPAVAAAVRSDDFGKSRERAVRATAPDLCAA